MDNNKHTITLKDLAIGYPFGMRSWKTILNDINVSANEGQLTAVIGRNGSGKSTLLKTIIRLNNSISGDIYLNEININNISRTAFAKQISFVSTEPINISNIKAIELISLGRYPYTNWLGKSDNIDKSVVNEAIDMLGLGDLAKKHFYNLSDGEKQKVMIARALVQDTKILILDEPTAFLDMPNKYEIISILNYIAKTKGKTIIFSTHDLNIAINEADKIWLINDNAITEGAPEDLMLNNSLDKFISSFSVNKNYDFVYDKETISFKISKSNNHSISLSGIDSHLFWTKKALERLGYNVELIDTLSTQITVINDNQTIKWKLNNKGIETTFSSIYDLANSLSNIN